MRKFVRQKGNGPAPDVELDFGAATAKIPRVWNRTSTASAFKARKSSNAMGTS